VYDGGLSRNGTFVNGERVTGHRVLRDRDELVVGGTSLWFRDPTISRASSTIAAGDRFAALPVSPAQRKVLIALCRPYKDRPAFAKPATNQQIADELFLSVDAIKTHLRTLFAKFGIEELPQNQKRVRLVELALKSGVVTLREL
jgi:DNA-binding CsgD family transcriptional regulator